MTTIQPPLTPQGYPASWPKPRKSRPDSLVSRITDEEKRQLYERELTTRDLAKRYDVRETWVSTLFPGKVEGASTYIRQKKVLTKIRKEYRFSQAALVLAGNMSTKEASKVCKISYRSMARAVQILKKAENEQS